MEAVERQSGLDVLRTTSHPPLPAGGQPRWVCVEEGDVVIAAVPRAARALAGLIEAVLGFAIRSTLRPDGDHVLLDLRVSYLRPVPPTAGEVYVRGWVRESGHQVRFAEADVCDVAGGVLATASATCLVVSAEERTR
ncbi:PaaI family thioesterase [Kutzneria sp. CA-103260]|uniref:PaaI family thioesterase n=1 Tax=Kutzneria sp. CA-103260 TaxID=2802641 RepID=UPI001BABA679|nr:PaaI family thioesterase [Kutzneria sp. CA-103260]QUQ66085.1 aromatic compounds degradation protein paaI [Kutzneria sp. CA-103260]